jgi:hypothetical protein
MAFRGLVAAVTPEVHVLGTGPDVSYVVIQEKSLNSAPLIFAYHYTYASNPPMNGDGLLSAIAASYPELQIQTTQYSFGKSLDAFDVQGTTVSSSTASDGNSGTYWSYYVSGGYDGSGAIGTNQWLYSQYGFDSRTITPGSCDGWTFASWQGTNEPSDIPPTVDVANIAALVAAASEAPTPTLTPTPTPLQDTNPFAISVGQGPDVSFVVIQESSLASLPIIFAYHYTNASSPPITGYQLLLAIHAGYPDFDFATTQFSFGKSLDAFRFTGTTVSSSTAPDGNGGYYWSYYLSGGYDGSGPVGTNSWSYSQYGFESRTIAPGSCDGWTLASWQGTNGMDVPPSIDPNFLATLSIGSVAVPVGTSASPSPVPSPKDGVTPSPSPTGSGTPAPVASASPSPSTTPQGGGVGGAVLGGILPVGFPQPASGAETPSMTTAQAGPSGAFSDSAKNGAGVVSAMVQEVSSVITASAQGGYAPPSWLQAGGFLASVDVSSLSASPSPDQGYLRIKTPFEPERLPIRDSDMMTSAEMTKGSVVGTQIPASVRKLNESSPRGGFGSLLHQITGKAGRFWKSLLQFLHLTRA